MKGFARQRINFNQVPLVFFYDGVRSDLDAEWPPVIEVIFGLRVVCSSEQQSIRAWASHAGLFSGSRYY
eukprot:scaffold1291_cov136-Amphora_coffeaeformis.AAC.3